MSLAAGRTVSVIVAAHNAGQTVARAVSSALIEPQVAEIIVVDDASNDNTAHAASAADDGTGRLIIYKLAANRGPAFARNHGIAKSTAPLISVLDADDFFIRGRFNNLLCSNDWDLIADNILFVNDVQNLNVPEVKPLPSEPRFIDLSAFVEGNIPVRGSRRTELSFLKPVMKREFLASRQLRYREDLRLGEDYDLYLRALAQGARFKLIHTCGYAALLRPTSLSKQHATEDLKRLCEVDQAIPLSGLSKETVKSLRRHENYIRGRYEHRRFLDIKSAYGLGAALWHGLQNPFAVPAIVGGILRDKFGPRKERPSAMFDAPPHLLSER